MMINQPLMLIFHFPSEPGDLRNVRFRAPLCFRDNPGRHGHAETAGQALPRESAAIISGTS